jgi:hypothetical protein
MRKLMARRLIISLIAIVLLLSIFVYEQLNGVVYELEETAVGDWTLRGGTIELKGLNREHSIGDLIYTGSGELEVQKITLELRTKTVLGLFPEESLSLSSIGGSETLSIEKGFSYGAVSGNTHSLSVLKSYFLKGIELRIQTYNINSIDAFVVEVPIR